MSEFRKHLEQKIALSLESHLSFKKQENALLEEIIADIEPTQKEYKESIALALNSQAASAWDMKCEYERLLLLFDFYYPSTKKVMENPEIEIIDDELFVIISAKVGAILAEAGIPEDKIFSLSFKIGRQILAERESK